MISFRSKITKKILNYFFINPHESLYINEISRRLRLDKRNLVKKIRELETEGILTHTTRGNLKLYSINRSYPLYSEYRKIVGATVGLQESLRRALKKMKGIKEAYIYGSYAKDTMDAHSDIDLLIVGEESTVRLQKKLNEFQKETGREINAINMDETEFRKKIRDKNSFIAQVFKQKYIKLEFVEKTLRKIEGAIS